MYLALDRLKTALDPSALEAEDVDAKLTNSATLAQALIEGYIGRYLEPRPETTESFIGDEAKARRLFLKTMPIISVEEITRDGEVVDSSQYKVKLERGTIDFGACFCGAEEIVVEYTAGYEVDTVPSDIDQSVFNMALVIYNLGGTFVSSATASTGALKSLTMFDAMSMSFDTGNTDASASNATTPEGLLEQWSFVLNKYRCNAPSFA